MHIFPPWIFVRLSLGLRLSVHGCMLQIYPGEVRIIVKSVNYLMVCDVYRRVANEKDVLIPITLPQAREDIYLLYKYLYGVQ